MSASSLTSIRSLWSGKSVTNNFYHINVKFDNNPEGIYHPNDVISGKFLKISMFQILFVVNYFKVLLS